MSDENMPWANRRFPFSFSHTGAVASFETIFCIDLKRRFAGGASPAPFNKKLGRFVSSMYKSFYINDLAFSRLRNQSLLVSVADTVSTLYCQHVCLLALHQLESLLH